MTETSQNVNNISDTEYKGSAEGASSSSQTNQSQTQNQSQTDGATVGDILALKNEWGSLLERAETRIRHTETITYFGFFIIVLMIVALVFSYIEFVYSGSKNDDYKYNISQQVSEQGAELKLLKECLKLGGWKDCF